MRGQVEQQGGMPCYFRPEDRVPKDHQLRAIKARAAVPDEAWIPTVSLRKQRLDATPRPWGRGQGEWLSPTSELVDLRSKSSSLWFRARVDAQIWKLATKEPINKFQSSRGRMPV
jgi:hypothetical protein